MKKRIISALCATVLTLALPLTALAAPSRAAEYVYLPSAEGKTAATYTQAEVEVVATAQATVEVQAAVEEVKAVLAATPSTQSAAVAEEAAVLAEIEAAPVAEAKIGSVPQTFTTGLLEAIQECYKGKASVLDFGKVAVKSNGNFVIRCNLASQKDTIKVLFYNAKTGMWEEKTALVAANGTLIVPGLTKDHTVYTITNQGKKN